MCVNNTRDEIISTFDVSNQAESSKSFCPHTTQGLDLPTQLIYHHLNNFLLE